MSFKHKFKPGDILSQKVDYMNNLKGLNSLIIGYDDYNYVAIVLHPNKLYPFSLTPSYIESERLYEKVGEIKLEVLPLDLEDLIDFAEEDDQDKWLNPPNLKELVNCSQLKQYLPD